MQDILERIREIIGETKMVIRSVHKNGEVALLVRNYN
jgi:hypothetical protein